MSDDIKINARHRQVLDLYRTDPERNIPRAYMAIYPNTKSKTSAQAAFSRMMKKPGCQEYLDFHDKKASDIADIKEADILKDLAELRDMCMGRKTIDYVRVSKMGVHEGQAMEFNAAGAARALELLGKNLKMFTDKIDHLGVTQHVEYNYNFSGQPATPQEKG